MEKDGEKGVYSEINGRDFDNEVKRDELPKFPENFVEFKGSYLPTYCGFQPDQCTSGLQKAIRRGFYRDAFQMGLELYRSGPILRTVGFNRLIIIAFEDVGLGDLFAIIDIYNLFKYRDKEEEELAFITGIYRLCGAMKSRINDNSVYLYPKSSVFDGTIETWENDLIDALKQKNGGHAHYYRQAIASHSGKVKIDGKGRETNSQALIWNAFKKLFPDNIYLKTVEEIAMLPNHKWKPAAQMYQTHCINMICLDIVPINDVMKEYTALFTTTKVVKPELQIYLDEHKERKNIKGMTDYAIDKHTRKGNTLGRSFVYFFEVGAMLHNENPKFAKISNRYFQEVKDNMKASGMWK